MHKYQEDDDITPKKAYNLAGELMVKAGWSAYKYEMEFSEKREKRKTLGKGVAEWKRWNGLPPLLVQAGEGTRKECSAFLPKKGREPLVTDRAQEIFQSDAEAMANMNSYVTSENIRPMVVKAINQDRGERGKTRMLQPAELSSKVI